MRFLESFAAARVIRHQVGNRRSKVPNYIHLKAWTLTDIDTRCMIHPRDGKAFNSLTDSLKTHIHLILTYETEKHEIT